MKDKEDFGWILVFIFALIFLGISISGLSSFTTDGEILFVVFFILSIIFFLYATTLRYF